MMGKLNYLFCICLTLASAAVWAIELQPEPDYGPVAYEFHWSVSDPHTGDIKSQKETRKDDKVVGQYTLIDADGYLRTVDYTVDDHNGFNALVRREPTDIKIPQPSPEPKKLIATKLLSPLTPLVHYAPKAILKAAEPSEGNYVSVLGPTAQYKY
ncbi:cuticle protein 7 [Drosophila hydei]|uniref:Cuticle protein 7 n=1 Tax=Drosophila hydei TaxID=7224 RepID=A0A6J1LVL8_DROHY|nr:cuticle protein 7 [Drosophila hydei]